MRGQWKELESAAPIANERAAGSRVARDCAQSAAKQQRSHIFFALEQSGGPPTFIAEQWKQRLAARKIPGSIENNDKRQISLHFFAGIF
jgi:hypothetical protein